MNIDISRVNFLEKDVEDWLYENPAALPVRYRDNPITKWIGRQYMLPSGIADLIGIREDGLLTVIEVKNVAINKAAVLQVCRYANDLKYILSERMDYPHTDQHGDPYVEMILVGPSIDDQTFTEARAVNVQVYQFTAQVHLDIARLGWTDDHFRARRAQHKAIASRPEWAIYGITTSEDVERFFQEQTRELEAARRNTDLDSGYSDIIPEGVSDSSEDDDEGVPF